MTEQELINKLDSKLINRVKFANMLGISTPTLYTRVRDKKFTDNEIIILKHKGWIDGKG